MSSDTHGSPITADEWRSLSAQESDILAILDPGGTCTWADGAPWLGRSIHDIFSSDDRSVLEHLLGAEPSGPVWVRQGSAEGDVVWLHAVSTPRSEGGWVLQVRRIRKVRSEAHSEANGLDHVTGVVARERALDEVAFLLAATPRTGKETAVACLALDDFASVRAQLGDDVADEVLRVVAGRVSDALRSGDLVARLDDHELLILLRGVHHLRGALRVANKVRTVVEDPIVVEDTEMVQTVCVGVTIISRGEGVDSVLERARGALAMAQEGGHNLVMSSPPI